MPTAVPPSIALSLEQEHALAFALEKISAPHEKGKPNIVALAGAAGTGKSTIMKELVRLLLEEKKIVQVCGMTNKAANVLKRKGVEDAITFHKAAMRPLLRVPYDKLNGFLAQSDVEDKTKVNYPESLLDMFEQSALETALETVESRGIYAAYRDLGIKDIFKYVDGWLPAPPQKGILVVDEASMLGGADLKTATEVYSNIILVGDEFQLPPVKDTPVFWKVSTRIALTQVHRQAAGSQPLELATRLRTTGKIGPVTQENISCELSRAGMPVIVWRNKTRIELTNAIRKKLGLEHKPPQVGEWLVCRNSSDRKLKSMGLLNNTLWKVVAHCGFRCDLVNEDGEEVQDVSVHMEEMDAGDGVPFRFAYVLSAHSSQGSQFERVQIHHGEVKAYWQSQKDGPQFLYTAITRAEKYAHFVTSHIA